MALTKDEMIERYSDDFLEEVEEFLCDYKDWLEEHEPHATNSIRRLVDVRIGLPTSMEDL